MSRTRLTLALGLICGALLGCLASLKPAARPAPAISITATPKTAPVAAQVRPEESIPKLSRTPVVSAIKNTGAITRLLAEFEETPRGDFEINASKFSATLSKSGELNYRPQLRDHSLSSLTLSLLSVSRGDAWFAKVSAEPAAAKRRGQSISIDRLGGTCSETYSPRGEGIEQEFTLSKLPAGTGDLRMLFSVATEGLKAAEVRPGRNGGISFLAADGTTAVRYGQVVVRDAAGKGISIEPHLDDSAHISFSLPERWLQNAALPIVIDPLVGTNIGISSDSSTTGQVAPPAIAVNGTASLVTWVDYSAGTDFPVMGASILSGSGLASAPFVISDPLGRPRQFRNQRTYSTSNGTNWLVVWTDDRSPGNGIRGSLIDSTGVVLGGTDFMIAHTQGLIEEDPLVAFNGIDFIVAWQDVPAGATAGTQIFYTRVSTAGVVAAATAIAATGSPNQVLEFLSPQVPSGDVLMLYRDANQSPEQTLSTRIVADGTLRDPGGTSLFKELLIDNGYGRPIGVTYVNGAWNILSSFDQTVDSSVFLHKFTDDGMITPPTGKFAEMGLGPTGSTLDAYAPVFAGSNEWLFVRNEKVSATVFHLLGKRVGFDGTDLDPVPFQIDTATQGVVRSPVAVPMGFYFAMAWLDGRNGATQLADGVEVFGALVDTTSPATIGTPLIAAVTASPTSGEAPLTVSFSPTLSTGTYDTVTWIFGDGTTSADAQVLHTYKKNGTYTAQLILTKGAYQVFDTALIFVGTGVSSGAPTQVGIPVSNSTDMQASLFIQSFVVNLNFVTTGTDTMQVSGTLDNSALPTELSGALSNVTVGNFSSTFTIDTNGSFKSDATKSPVRNFTVVPTTGAFIFQVANADLVSTFDALGAHNETVAIKDNRIVMVPISVTVGGYSATAKVGFQYHSLVDSAGAGGYIFQSTGDEVSGSFLVTKFAAKEATVKKLGTKVHTFTLSGQFLGPAGAAIIPDPAQNAVMSIGNFSSTFPASQLTAKKGTLKFSGKKITSGMSQFTVGNKGKLAMKFVQIDALASGVPVANSGDNILNINLNLSVTIPLVNGGQLTAGKFLPVERTDAASKIWGLRGTLTKK